MVAMIMNIHATHNKYLLALFAVFVSSGVFAQYYNAPSAKEKNGMVVNEIKKELSDLKTSGGPIPQFGKWIDKNGNVVCSKTSICIRRPLLDRFEDYWHPCVLRNPKKKVPNSSIKKWKTSTFLKKDISALESVAAENVMDEILALEDLLVNVEAECIRYGVARASYTSVSALNAMLSPNNHYNWVKLARSGKKSDWFKGKIQVVEQYISSRLDVLDGIHMREFDQWCSDPENEAKYMELQRAANGIGFGATVRRNIVKEAEAKVNKGIQEERQIAEAKRMEYERSINEFLAENRRHNEAVMRESNIAMQMEEAKRAAEDAQWQVEEMRRRTEDLKRDLSLQGIEVFP